ncbi:hypothetical protein [Nocardioides sp. TF02-7]|uniref:hypothetical protein n=1 Tax=Nocardioides sp. TF02-7 TaxID=2917724 RepID=UPI001F058BA0|nr:hypothetical protein [Nocardioides sp. TF02-7]UMG94411.1 hypothetical protein MF408_10740 [Nocardioides sp. TF02-7]
MALAVVGLLAGAWAAHFYDIVRVNVLDIGLAHEVGYAGEITDATPDPEPLGISRSGWLVALWVSIPGLLVTYPATVVARRGTGDPNAVAFALAAAAAGALVGFVVVAAAWLAVPPRDWNLAEQVVRFGALWVPLLLAAVIAALVRAWWSSPGDPREDRADGAPTG